MIEGIEYLRSISDDVPADVIYHIYGLSNISNTPVKTAYVSYLSEHEGHVVERIFAYRRSKAKGMQYTEVCRRMSGCEGELLRNIYFVYLAGYIAVYDTKSINTYYFYRDDFNKWFESRGKHIGIYTDIINTYVLKNIPKYKYCAYDKSCGDIMAYLNRFETEPMVEYFGKMGLEPQKSLLSLCKKDKMFCKYLRDNYEKTKKCGAKATIYAYKHKISIEMASKILYDVYNIGRDTYTTRGTGIEPKRLAKYLCDHAINYAMYKDYLKAIKSIGLDLYDTKNIYPIDFQRMHDLRINQYHSKQAEEDKEKRKQLWNDFGKVSEEYKRFNNTGTVLSIVIPTNPGELVTEGDALHHCVGQLGYDKKMADKKSLIFFVRQNDKIETPYVTIEVSLPAFSLQQCYADHDSNPGDDVKAYVNDWCERCQCILKHEQRKAKRCSTRL